MAQHWRLQLHHCSDITWASIGAVTASWNVRNWSCPQGIGAGNGARWFTLTDQDAGTLREPWSLGVDWFTGIVSGLAGRAFAVAPLSLVTRSSRIPEGVHFKGQRKPSYGFSDLLSDMWLQIFLEIFLWTLADFSWNFVDSSLHLHGFLVHSFEGFITDQKMTLEPWILYQMAWANLFITYTCSSFLLNSVVVLVARQLHIQSHSSWPVSASIDV